MSANPFEQTCAWMWDDADDASWEGGRDRERQILWSFEFLGCANTADYTRRPDPRPITPALPARRVRVVLSHFERDNASRMAWDWLGRTEADDDAVVAAIREASSCGTCGKSAPEIADVEAVRECTCDTDGASIYSHARWCPLHPKYAGGTP